MAKGSYDNGAKVNRPNDKKIKGYALGVQLVKSLPPTATRDIMILGEMANLPSHIVINFGYFMLGLTFWQVDFECLPFLLA